LIIADALSEMDCLKVNGNVPEPAPPNLQTTGSKSSPQANQET